MADDNTQNARYVKKDANSCAAKRLLTDLAIKTAWESDGGRYNSPSIGETHESILKAMPFAVQKEDDGYYSLFVQVPLVVNDGYLDEGLACLGRHHKTNYGDEKTFIEKMKAEVREFYKYVGAPDVDIDAVKKELSRRPDVRNSLKPVAIWTPVIAPLGKAVVSIAGSLVAASGGYRRECS